jgi:hypothetical protein
VKDKSYESFKQKLKSGSAPLHIQEVVSGGEIGDMRPEKRIDINKEKINQKSRQLNVEISEQTFIKLKTRAVEERVALRKLVEEAVWYYLNRK